MLYLLDADAIITGDRDAYPLDRFPIFWEWLFYMAAEGTVKIPIEQYEEITNGKGPIVDWCKRPDVRAALLLDEQATQALVSRVTQEYATDLNEDEIEQIGRDPFLVAYGLVALGSRTVVTFERSAPGKQRANRKVPDVCAGLGVPCCTLYNMIRDLDFTTNWQPGGP